MSSGFSLINVFLKHACVFLAMMLFVLRDLRFLVGSIHLANVVWLFFTDDHSMFAFTMSCETVTCLAFVLAHGARKPCSVDIVDTGKMTLQLAICFKHGPAHVARKPSNADVVLVGKMIF